MSETGDASPTRPHGIGIVGTGAIAGMQAAAIAAVPGARLVAVTDVVPERAAAFAGARGCAAAYWPDSYCAPPGCWNPPACCCACL